MYSRYHLLSPRITKGGNTKKHKNINNKCSCAVLTIPAMSCEKPYKKVKTFSMVKFTFLTD